MRRSGTVPRALMPPLLADRFEAPRALAGGANATVFVATDRTLAREVAVKVFEPDDGASRAGERFEREIGLTARLLHPLIVPVLDHGVLGGHRFYVMPFVTGTTLRARLSRDGPVTVAELLAIALDLCEALAHAHAMEVLHRDVKPENIFHAGARAVLADFGIATMLGGSGMRLTESGVVRGTVLYMSPEQIGGNHDLDGRADLYALGCVLWELLTGRPPFDHPNVMQLMALHLNAPLPALTGVHEAVPHGLATLLRGLLEKSRQARPDTALAVHAELQALRAAETGALARPRATPTPAYVDAVTPSMLAYRHGRTMLSRAMTGGTGAAESLQVARTYFERAIALDAENDVARLGLAEVLQAIGGMEGGDAAGAQRESKALRRSTFERPELGAEACALLGETLMYWDDDLGGAGRMFARALAIDGGNPEALGLYGRWLGVMAREEEAIAHLRAAVQLAPHDVALHLALGDALARIGREVEALGCYRTARELNAHHPPTLDRLARTAHRVGLGSLAATARRALLAERNDRARLDAFDADMAAGGWARARRADLAREVGELMQRARREDPFQARGAAHQLSDDLLVALADMSHWTEAMDCVAEGARRRPTRMRLVLTDLPFHRRGLATDPRYALLLRQLGLEELL